MSTLAMMNEGKCISGYPRESSMKLASARSGPAHLHQASASGKASRGHTSQRITAALGMVAVLLTLSTTMQIVGSQSKINKT